MPSYALLQRAATVLMLCSGLATAAPSGAWASHKPTHVSTADTAGAFDHAERMREALEGRPEGQRTRAAYAKVLDAYRAIYYTTPTSPHADAAIDAVASLLAEEGRALNDTHLLQNAVEQYEYLRSTHPASPFRQSALLSEAEIQQSDLHDDSAAQQSFAAFLKQYPHSPLAGEARQQLKALNRRDAPATTNAYQQPQQPQPSGHAATMTEAAREHARQLAELNATPPDTAAPSSPAPQMPRPAVPNTAVPIATSPAMHRAGRPILITGIRHWSTPVYTRVAIDLSDQVQFEAARVPNPDRIFFDLHGAHLAPELIGKSVDVTDDGYLKRVRVAQYSNDSSRIVLDVSHVSEYSAFFLPNPWRLIIDIHGAANGSSPVPQQASSPADDNTLRQTASASSRRIDNPTSIMAAGGANANASTAPLQEVTTLGQQANRVKATRHPTTSPIAASVSGTRRAAQPNELEELASSAPVASSPAPAPRAAEPAAMPGATNDASATPPAVRRTHRLSSTSDIVTNSATNTTKLPTHLAPEIPSAGAREATPTSTGERSLVRALGLKIGRIVIDAGHGGHDSGTLGPGGIEEKDVVLDVALRLGKLLKQRLGADVIYTRDDDTFIPLETRTAIANKAQADLFISVHANSSSDASARGVEVYYLNFTTSPEALEVAARENAVSDQSIYQLSDLVKKITLKDKIDESHEFAANVESSLYSGLEEGNAGLKDRGVKKAPFVVLIGANMPSILAEISFLTNPEDARELRDPAYRERIAESLYRGIEKYVSGLSGVRLAQTGSRPSGQ
jgi:N-acetylmuramoyl-L-alanine amidase